MVGRPDPSETGQAVHIPPFLARKVRSKRWREGHKRGESYRPPPKLRRCTRDHRATTRLRPTCRRPPEASEPGRPRTGGVGAFGTGRWSRRARGRRRTHARWARPRHAARVTPLAPLRFPPAPAPRSAASSLPRASRSRGLASRRTRAGPGFRRPHPPPRSRPVPG